VAVRRGNATGTKDETNQTKKEQKKKKERKNDERGKRKEEERRERGREERRGWAIETIGKDLSSPSRSTFRAR
jgi:hypothetical protein